MLEISMIIRTMSYMPRKILKKLTHALHRGKSVLLLGARQTGKTTFINQEIKPDIAYSFARAATRQRYEQNPALLESVYITVNCHRLK